MNKNEPPYLCSYPTLPCSTARAYTFAFVVAFRCARERSRNTFEYELRTCTYSTYSGCTANICVCTRRHCMLEFMNVCVMCGTCAYCHPYCTEGGCVRVSIGEDSSVHLLCLRPVSVERWHRNTHTLSLPLKPYGIHPA